MKPSVLMIGIVTAALGAAAAVACGSETGVAGIPDSGDAAAESSVPPGSSSGSSGSPDGSADSGSSRPADDAGVTADGGVDPPDAGPGGNTTSIACGSTTCIIPAESCCVSEVAGGGNNAYTCVLGSTCPTPPGGGDTAALKCSGAANCIAGTVCCVRDDNGNAASECKTSCGNGEAQLCDPRAADAGCPQADPCSNNNIGDWGQLPDSYGTCGGQGT